MAIAVAAAVMVLVAAPAQASGVCSNVRFIEAAHRPIVLEGYAYDNARQHRWKRAQRWSQDAYLAMSRTPTPCRRSLDWFRGYKMEMYVTLAAAYDAFADGDAGVGAYLLDKALVLQDRATKALGQ